MTEAAVTPGSAVATPSPSRDASAAVIAGEDAHAIAAAVGRLEAIVARRPGYGSGTDISVTTLQDGLRCSSEEGPWRVETDMPKAFGSGAAAPTPAVLLRAALGSCLAMGYRLRAARRGIELTTVTVTVEADSALVGMLDPEASAPPGYTEFRYHVEVQSPAPADEVIAVLDEGDQLSPLLDALGRGNRLRRTTSVRTAAVPT